MIRNILREVMGYSLIQLNHLRKANRNPGIVSIYFHNPSKILFDKLILWLIDSGYRFISLEELNFFITEKITSEKLAIITFDDGWNQNLELLESIEKYNVPVAIFMPIEAVKEGNYWWEYASQEGQYQYSHLKGNEDFKKLPNDLFTEKVSILKHNYNLKRSCITLEELRKISKLKLITIGSHTVTHPILNKCSPEKQENELIESKQTLSKWLNKEVDYLSYPNGDYDEHTIAIAKKCGYKLAFATTGGKIDVKNVNPYIIPRHCMNDNGGYFENISKISGIWQKLLKK